MDGTKLLSRPVRVVWQKPTRILLKVVSGCLPASLREQKIFKLVAGKFRAPLQAFYFVFERYRTKQKCCRKFWKQSSKKPQSFTQKKKQLRAFLESRYTRTMHSAYLRFWQMIVADNVLSVILFAVYYCTIHSDKNQSIFMYGD